MSKINKYWTLLEDLLTGIFFISGLSLIFYGVIMRYFFKNPRPWVDEIAMYSIIWGILFGLSIALRNDKHIGIDLFYDRLSPKLQRIVNIISNSVGVLFCVFLVFYSMNLVLSTYENGLVSMTIGLPMWLVYLILPTSGIFFLIRFFERLIKDIRKESIL